MLDDVNILVKRTRHLVYTGKHRQTSPECVDWRWCYVVQRRVEYYYVVKACIRGNVYQGIYIKVFKVLQGRSWNEKGTLWHRRSPRQSVGRSMWLPLLKHLFLTEACILYQYTPADLDEENASISVKQAIYQIMQFVYGQCRFDKEVFMWWSDFYKVQ